jgi:hypothetical protein
MRFVLILVPQIPASEQNSEVETYGLTPVGLYPLKPPRTLHHSLEGNSNVDYRIRRKKGHGLEWLFLGRRRGKAAQRGLPLSKIVTAKMTYG